MNFNSVLVTNIITIRIEKSELIYKLHVRFEVLTTVNKKTAVFWDVTQCSLAEYHRRFGGTYEYILHLDIEELLLAWLILRIL
jgi:hypothetical protein